MDEHTQIIKTREQPQKCIGIKFNPGIAALNFIGVLAINVATFTSIGISLTFISSILADPEYYNIPKKEIGQKYGFIASCAQAAVIMVEFVSGPVIDIVGRKYAVIIGIVVTGISIGMIPLFTELYPGFFIARVLMAVGTVVGLNIPLLADYVDKDSIGQAQSLIQVIITLSSIFSMSGLFAIHNVVTDQKYIYFGVAVLFLAIALFNCFAIKEVVRSSDKIAE